MQSIACLLSVLSVLLVQILAFASDIEKPREVGRPRVFGDDAIFVATASAIAQCGYSRLTLDEVAGALGCTRQGLARRFGSKYDLVRAYLVWVVDQAAIRCQELREEQESPLAALRAVFLSPADDATGGIADLADRVNMLSFFIGASENPEFRALLRRLLQFYEEEATCLLQQANDAGELKLSDARELAHTLIAAITGEMSLWASISESPLTPRLTRIFDAVLEPYQISSH